MILSLVCILMIRKFLSASMTSHVQIIKLHNKAGRNAHVQRFWSDILIGFVVILRCVNCIFLFPSL